MSIEITPELLAELKDKAEAAESLSRSPWKINDDGVSVDDWHGDLVCEECLVEEAEFIAAANPAVVLALVARIEELEAKNVS